MAIYHLNIKTISRGKGQSATASAAYRSGEKLYSDYYGETNFYRREVKPEIFILKPDHAPEWCLNRETLWNEVERIEKPRNAQLSRELNIALPIELTEEEQTKLTKEYVQENFVDEGMVADVAIHRDDSGNPHFHVMLTTRPFNLDGSWGSKAKRIILKDEDGNDLYYENGDKKSRKDNSTDWNSKEKIYIWRKNWATLVNSYLENNGIDERISEKSYTELGEEKRATIHEGYAAREIEKRGAISDRSEQNRQIKKGNYERQEYKKETTSTATVKVILQPLSPKEKGELKKIAKNLKVYVDYNHLIDKERMVNNWERAEKINQLIHPQKMNESMLEKIKSTKEDVDRGKEILEAQFIRIYENYYPALQERSFSSYQKMCIGQASLEADTILNDSEIVAVLQDSRDNEVNQLLRTIAKNPYNQPIVTYERKFVHAAKQLDEFYEEHGVTQDTVHTLSGDQKEEFKKLYRNRTLQYDSINLLETYYNQTILASYPTVDLSQLKPEEKEELAKAIAYYGNTLSYTKLVEASQEIVIQKYNAYEQKMGLSFIKKMEEGTFTPEDLQAIEQDFRKKEIWDTITNPTTKQLFLNEVSSNQELSTDEWGSINEGGSSSPSLLQKLAKNSNVYDNLLRASEDNARRMAQQKYEKSNQEKHPRSVQMKKKKAKGTRSL